MNFHLHLQKLVLRASFEDAAADFPRRMAEMHQTRRTGPQAEEQRTQAWFAMRENRLTASTFGNAAGYAISLQAGSRPSLVVKENPIGHWQ